MNKLHKSLLVGLGAVVLSTVAIQASDLVRGISGSLSGLVIESEGVCGNGATQFHLGSHSICIDMYEASPSGSCPSQVPSNNIDTQNNANSSSCFAESKEGVLPWRFVSLTQAQQFCARAGKRLPTNEEWYKVASGLGDNSSCITKSQNAALTGSSDCVTPSGVHDMVGNVWEWVDEQAVEGKYHDRMLPQTGYVSLVDSNGAVLETSTEAQDEFGKDYAWTSNQGIKGMIRGGFYASGEDAGMFSQNISVPFDFKTAGVGFRCVRDV